MSSKAPILRLTDGLFFQAGQNIYIIDPLRLHAGQWVLFVPSDEVPVPDPSGTMARTLVTLSPPIRGTLEVFEQDGYSLNYRDAQRLRARLGFVQGFGGMLSNRTVRENVSLPLVVHGKLSLQEEHQRVSKIMEQFQLDTVQDFKPYLVDGYTRWRACLARALILNPKFVVLEGIGDWDIDGGMGIAWQQLLTYHQKRDNVVCICASRRNNGFESWFVKNDGILVDYFRKSNIKAPVRSQY